MMKMKVYSWLFGSVFLLSSCMKLPNHTWVSAIKDLKGEEVAVWHLGYDYKGRLVNYGNTPIVYDNNEVRIGKMDWDYKGEQLLSATYYLSSGEVFRSEAKCLWLSDSTDLEVLKEVDYQYSGDTILMESTYRTYDDHLFLRHILTEYVYNIEGNLAEIMSQYVDADGKTSACHNFYSYEGNIRYESNLNLQSFFIDAEGTDSFFFFLLNMDGKFSEKKLPTRIRFCENHGKAVYVADGLYRLDGELPTKAEVISDGLKLKARLEFEYFE